MSAPNFRKRHARRYYVIGAPEWEYDDYEDAFRDLEFDTPTLLKDFLGSVLGSGERNCLPVQDWMTRTWNQDYPGALLASARIYPDNFIMPYTKTEIECSVIINIYLVSGYYAGATLDWDLGFRYEETKMLSEYGNKEELIEDVADYIFQDLEYYEADIETPKKRAALKKWLAKIFDTYANKADGFCEQHCTQALNCVEVYSNGEAVYEKA